MTTLSEAANKQSQKVDGLYSEHDSVLSPNAVELQSRMEEVNHSVNFPEEQSISSFSCINETTGSTTLSRFEYNRRDELKKEMIRMVCGYADNPRISLADVESLNTMIQLHVSSVKQNLASLHRGDD